MGQLILQMMISLDGMVSGPKGELDWIAHDKDIEQDHLDRLEQAKVMVIGGGLYPDMPRFWRDTAADENADALSRDIGRAMNRIAKVIYTHQDVPADQPDDTVRVIKSDQELVDDLQRLKNETDGTIISYGGVRFARSLMRLDLVDELHLDICPVILGEGQPLFSELTHGTKLRLVKSVVHDSGTAEMRYVPDKS